MAFLLVLPHTPTLNSVETGASTANISWSHDSTCFEECHFEYMLTVVVRDHYYSSMHNMPYWIRVNMTQYLLSNLYSGTSYVVMLNAYCTTKSVWSATVSTNFTTILEQRNEGKVYILCYIVIIIIWLCEHMCNLVSINMNACLHCFTLICPYNVLACKQHSLRVNVNVYLHAPTALTCNIVPLISITPSYLCRDICSFPSRNHHSWCSPSSARELYHFSSMHMVCALLQKGLICKSKYVASNVHVFHICNG